MQPQYLTLNSLCIEQDPVGHTQRVLQTLVAVDFQDPSVNVMHVKQTIATYVKNFSQKLTSQMDKKVNQLLKVPTLD